ncbi:MAG: DUF202 domain-containing protein [Candidatus Binataceae bacterium]
MADPRLRRTVLDSSTELAVARTRASYERTMMSWIRTATSLITFGFSIYKFFQIETPPRTHATRLNRTARFRAYTGEHRAHLTAIGDARISPQYSRARRAIHRKSTFTGCAACRAHFDSWSRCSIRGDFPAIASTDTMKCSDLLVLLESGIDSNDPLAVRCKLMQGGKVKRCDADDTA